MVDSGFVSLSVVIPAYNAQRYIGSAIESLLTCDRVTEVLVVNDGSTDDTDTVVLSFGDSRLRYFQQENSGVSAARNLGLHEAKGDYVIFLDADDLICVEAMLRCLSILDNSRCDIMFYGVNSFTETNGIKKFLGGNEYDIPHITNGVSGIACFTSLLNAHCEIGSSCRAFYLREFLIRNSIDFVLGMRYSEDLLFVRKALICSGSVLTCQEKVLLRRYSNDSALARASACDRFEGRLTAYLEFIKFVAARHLADDEIKCIQRIIDNDWAILSRHAVVDLNKKELEAELCKMKVEELDPRLKHRILLISYFRLALFPMVWMRNRFAGFIKKHLL